MVKINGETGSCFTTSRGTSKGLPISPTVFITQLERVLDRIKKEVGVRVSGTKINNLRFADDILLRDENQLRLEHTIQNIKQEAECYGLNMD